MVEELAEHKVTGLDFLALAQLAEGNVIAAKQAFELSATTRNTISPKYGGCYWDYSQALLFLAKGDRDTALEFICIAAEKVPGGPMKPFDEYVVLNILQILRSMKCDEAMHEYHLLETHVLKHLHGLGRATWLDEFQLLSLIENQTETPEQSANVVFDERELKMQM